LEIVDISVVTQQADLEIVERRSICLMFQPHFSAICITLKSDIISSPITGFSGKDNPSNMIRTYLQTISIEKFRCI
jgi:hypothetical protein